MAHGDTTLDSMRAQRLVFAMGGAWTALMSSGCAIIGGIFKAGAVTGIVGVLLLVVVVLFVVSRFSKSGS